MDVKTRAVAGDETTGFHAPDDTRPCDWPRISTDILERLSAVQGLTPTASDILDEFGLPLVVGADVLPPRVQGARIAGQAVTIRYLPERRSLALDEDAESHSRLAHRAVLSLCRSGDVLVIDAGGLAFSSFGGMAAAETAKAGLAGVIVDGAARDVDEIEAVGLPVWSRSVTPRTGKFRLEATQINAPVCCGGQQVVAGDLVLADATGICFVPVEIAERVAHTVLEVAHREMRHLRDSDRRN